MAIYAYLKPCSIETKRGHINGRKIVYLTGPDYGTESGPMRLAEAREVAKAKGLTLSLPGISEVRAYTSAKNPKFFSHSNRRLLDRKRGAHRLSVVRLPDGAVGVTNGRSTWVWTGDDLQRIQEGA